MYLKSFKVKMLIYAFTHGIKPLFMNPEICQTVSNYKANNDTGKT